MPTQFFLCKCFSTKSACWATSPTLKEVLSTLDGNTSMDEINEKGTLTIVFEGVEEVLEKDDLLIDAAQVEGFVSESYGGITVVLDTNLTPELVEEGFVYEVISKIQTMRKDADFEVTDHIRVFFDTNDRIAEIVEANREAIADKVLAEEMLTGQMQGISKEWNVNGEDVMIGIERL